MLEPDPEALLEICDAIQVPEPDSSDADRVQAMRLEIRKVELTRRRECDLGHPDRLLILEPEHGAESCAIREHVRLGPAFRSRLDARDRGVCTLEQSTRACSFATWPYSAPLESGVVLTGDELAASLTLLSTLRGGPGRGFSDLIAAGRAPSTPAVFIENASLANERRVVTTLAQLSAGPAPAFEGPALLFVGDVFSELHEAEVRLAITERCQARSA